MVNWHPLATVWHPLEGPGITYIVCGLVYFTNLMGRTNAFIFPITIPKATSSTSRTSPRWVFWGKNRDSMGLAYLLYVPWPPKTMKNQGLGHPTTRLFTIKTSKNVGFGALFIEAMASNPRKWENCVLEKQRCLDHEFYPSLGWLVGWGWDEVGLGWVG